MEARGRRTSTTATIYVPSTRAPPCDLCWREPHTHPAVPDSLRRLGQGRRLQIPARSASSRPSSGGIRCRVKYPFPRTRKELQFYDASITRPLCNRKQVTLVQAGVQRRRRLLPLHRRHAGGCSSRGRLRPRTTLGVELNPDSAPTLSKSSRAPFIPVAHARLDLGRDHHQDVYTGPVRASTAA